MDGGARGDGRDGAAAGVRAGGRRSIRLSSSSCPNKAAAEKLIDRASTSATVSTSRSRGFVKATIVATAQEKAQLEAHGLSRGRHDPDAGRRRCAARRAPGDDRRRERPRKAALDSAAGKKPSAAVGTVRAQHADYWEDAGGRWLSIEGTTTQAAVTAPRTVHRPAARRVLVRRQRHPDRQRQPAARTSTPDVTPVAPYLYHVTRFRLGDAATIGTPMPSFIRIAAPNGDVAQLDGQEVGRQRRPAVRRRASSRTSTRTTWIRRRATSGSRISPRSTRTSRRSTTCRTRRRATSARRRPWSASTTLYTGSTHGAPATAEQAKAGRPDVEGLGPGRRQQHRRPARQPGRRRRAARRQRQRQRDHASTWRPTPPARSPARPRRSSTRSTPTRPPPRSSPRRMYRTNTGAGVVTPRRRVDTLSDWLQRARRATRAARRR